MAKKKTPKRRISKSPLLGAPYKNEQTFVTECPKCSKVYTAEDINGGRCTGVGCGTMINDPYARAASTIKNAAKAAELAALKAENERLERHVADLMSGKYVNCVYCGHRYGPAGKTPVTQAELLHEHIKKCEKHPLCALQKKFNRLDNAIISIYNNLWAEEDDEGNVTLNPDKDWDSAADFMEHVCAQLDTILPRPKTGATDVPEYLT